MRPDRGQRIGAARLRGGGKVRPRGTGEGRARGRLIITSEPARGSNDATMSVSVRASRSPWVLSMPTNRIVTRPSEPGSGGRGGGGGPGGAVGPGGPVG